MFMAGLDPTVASWRADSVKGLLRFWHRAVDPHYVDAADQAFGRAGERQSACLLTVAGGQHGVWNWRPEQYDIFDRQIPGDAIRYNGAKYLAYSLALAADAARGAIPSGEELSLTIQPKPRHDSPQIRRAWVAALWLLANLGGAGSRARRGFGSLRIVSWEGWEEANELPAGMARCPEDWQRFVGEGLGTLRGWFGSYWGPFSHTVIGPGTRVELCPQAYDLAPGAQPAELGFGKWQAALNDAGMRLQSFRRRYGQGDPRGDYSRLIAHLDKSVVLTEGPERAGFGLPLTFQHHGRSTTFARRPLGLGQSPQRLASPLFVRIAALGGTRRAAVFVSLCSPGLGGAQLSSSTNAAVPESPRAATVVESFLNAQAGTVSVTV